MQSKDDELTVTDLMDGARISFILGIYSNFNNYDPDSQVRNSNLISKYSIDNISNFILDYMHEHRELEDLSMTVTMVKGLYRYEYGCPEDGKDLYKVTSLYNPAYKQSKEKWMESIIEYAKKLSEFFTQSVCTVIFENCDSVHPLQYMVIKHNYKKRTML